MTAYVNIKIDEIYDVVDYLNSNGGDQLKYKQPPCIEELKVILESDVAKSMGAKSKLAEKMRK